MAKCDFGMGLQNVSGTLSKQVVMNNGKRETVRVVASMRGGKQRLYLRRDTPRSTAPTTNEIQRWQFFSEANQRAANISEEAKLRLYDDWKKAKMKFNGKKYVSFRGYVVARIYAELKEKSIGANPC